MYTFLHCILSGRTIFSPIARTESEKLDKRFDWLMSTWRGEPSRKSIKAPARKGSVVIRQSVFVSASSYRKDSR